MASRFGGICREVAMGALAAVALLVGLVPATAGTANAAPPSLIISEVAPWGSAIAAYAADWFELTNNGTAAIDITGWKMDDNSASFALAVPLAGVTSIGAGQSVIFIEGTAATATAFTTAWFGVSPPGGFAIGTYSGAGVGLSATADAVNIYNPSGVLQAGVTFGASTNFRSFDNAAGLNNQAISTLSTVGVNGAFTASDTADGTEIGSPGATAPTPVVPEVPYAILLPASVIAILGAGIYLKRQLPGRAGSE